MLIVVDKPKWISSFDVIRVLKRELKEKKVWHSWTLDPMATGLLLVWTANDTKKLNELIWLDKTYETIIDFSKKSDTRDMDYRDYFEQIDTTWKKLSLSEIKTKLDLLIPECELPLTPFSAKKKNWQKLYDLARQWEQIVENRIMKTHWYDILDYEFPELKLRIEVWSWTYIRSIWYRLWQQFGLWWILTMLRRVKIWNYDLSKMNLDKTATFFCNVWDDIVFKYWIIW